jgi:hypothetical protein
MTTLTDNRLRGGEAALAEEGLLLQLAQLAEACAHGHAGLDAAAIEAASGLTALLMPAARVERIPALLAAGAVESAALALVPEEAGYMLSRGNGGWHLASFVLPGLDEEITAEGPTMALALIGAMAGALRAALQCGVLSAYPPAGSRVN